MIAGTIHNKTRFTKIVYVQVKNEAFNLNLCDYKDLLSIGNDEVWLFSDCGHTNINQEQKPSIVCSQHDTTIPSGYSMKPFQLQALLDFTFGKNISPILSRARLKTI